MWLITPTGFYSAVQHRDNPALLVVRTRDYADALRLAQFVALETDNIDDPEDLIVSYKQSDYPWRVITPRGVWTQWCAEEVAGIDYGNFKDAVKHRQGATRANIYSSVWSVLLRLEDHDPKNTRSWGNPIDLALEEAYGYDYPDEVITEDFHDVNEFLTKKPAKGKKNKKWTSKWR